MQTPNIAINTGQVLTTKGVRENKSWVSSLVTDGLIHVGRAQTLDALQVVADGLLPLGRARLKGTLPDVADGRFPLGRADGLFPLGRAGEGALLVVAIDEV